MALQDLRHPYICGYKEFFVTWDKQVCSEQSISKTAQQALLNG